LVNLRIASAPNNHSVMKNDPNHSGLSANRGTSLKPD
jgi:hypothetical protein